MIKAIAVDMDGTFLNSNNDYDRKAFLELFKKLKAKEVRFVVASGNQYAQISSFFPEIWREITFVSENGGLVFEKGNLLIKYHCQTNYSGYFDSFRKYFLQSWNYSLWCTICLYPQERKC